jgi:pilus assembly protein CpaF
MPEVAMYMTPPTRPVAVPEVRITLGEAARHALKTSVHHELIRRMDLEKLAAIQADEQTGRQRLLAIILQLIAEQNAPLSAPDRDRLAHDILDEVFGLGPLEPLLHDPHRERHSRQHLQDRLCRAARSH